LQINAASELDISRDWQVMPVKEGDGSAVEKVLPENGEWRDGGALSGKVPLADGAKGGNNLDGHFNAWYRRQVEMPKEWLGGSVRFEQRLNFMDLVVFVNGKKAGVAFHPAGSVELSPFLKAGENVVEVEAEWADAIPWETVPNAKVYTCRVSMKDGDPLAHADPDTSLPADERPIGGLGIMMVRKMSNSMSYERVRNRNLLTVVKLVS
jgi:hypothetical protein